MYDVSSCLGESLDVAGREMDHVYEDGARTEEVEGAAVGNCCVVLTREEDAVGG